MARRGTSWAAAEFHGKSGAGREEGPNGAVPHGEGKSGQWGERGGVEKTASRVRGKPATTTAVERDDSSREHRALLFLATVHVRLSTCALVCNVVYRAHTSKQLAVSCGTV